MGALSGGGVLNQPHQGSDVERFRALTRPTAVVQRAGSPLLVLGSTQSAGVVDTARADAAGVAVRRRRGGGGAVLVLASTVWVDLWLPAAGPHHSADAALTARQVGGWWRAGLAAAGATGLEVAPGGTPGGADSRLVCFAGLGAGEVHHQGRKVVGLTQWRSRQGSLVQGAAYPTFEPAPLLGLLRLEASERDRLTGVLGEAAIGWADVGAAAFTSGHLLAALPGGWDVQTTG